MPFLPRKPSEADAADELTAPALPTEEQLEFDVVKRGYDPEQVARYVEHLLAAHEDELDRVQERLISTQQAGRDTEAQLEQRIAELQEEAAQARQTADEMRAAAFQLDPEAEAELVAARGRIAQLENEIEALRAGAGVPDSASQEPLEAELDELRAIVRQRETAASAAVVRAEAAEKALADVQRRLDVAERDAAAAHDVDAVQAQLRADLVEARQQAETLRAELDQARGDAARSTHEVVGELEAARHEVRSLTGRVQELEAHLAAAEAQTQAHVQTEEALRARLAEQEAQLRETTSHVQRLQEETLSVQAENERAVQDLHGQLRTAQSAADLAKDRADQLSARIQKLEEERLELTQKVSASSGLEFQLQQAKDMVANAERRADTAQTQLDELRVEYAQTLREAAKAGARVDMLERDLEQLRSQQADFGESARRMMQALKESREQQEAELAEERKQALAEAEQIRGEARAEAENVTLQALQAVSEAETQRQQLTDAARDRAREVLADLHREVEQITAAAQTQAETARQNEEQLRQSARKAMQIELEHLDEQRRAVEQDIATLRSQRDELAQHLSRMTSPSDSAAPSRDIETVAVPSPAAHAEEAAAPETAPETADLPAPDDEPALPASPTSAAVRPASVQIPAVETAQAPAVETTSFTESQPEPFSPERTPAQENDIAPPVAEDSVTSEAAPLRFSEQAEAQSVQPEADQAPNASVPRGEDAPSSSSDLSAWHAVAEEQPRERPAAQDVEPLSLPSLDESVAAAPEPEPAQTDVPPLDLPFVDNSPQPDSAAAAEVSSVEPLPLPALAFDAGTSAPAEESSGLQLPPLDLSSQPAAHVSDIDSLPAPDLNDLPAPDLSDLPTPPAARPPLPPRPQRPSVADIARTSPEPAQRHQRPPVTDTPQPAEPQTLSGPKFVEEED